MEQVSRYYSEKGSLRKRFPKHVLYLLGLPGVGKTTVGKVIATKTGFAFLDNHLIYREICRFLPKGTRPTHLLNGRIHLAILNMILCSTTPGVVCTFSIRHQPTKQIALRSVKIAEQKGAIVNFVKIECDWKEHQRRVQLPSRRGMYKTMTIKKLKTYMESDCFEGLKKYPPLIINNTKISASKCAEKIISAFGFNS